MFKLVCRTCGASPGDMAATACPHDGGILNVIYDSHAIPVDPAQPGIWRYAARLPLDDHKNIISLGEGGTPLLSSAQLGPASGLTDVHFKNETMNPTGSYKDRILTVAMSQLIEQGKGTWGHHLVGKCRRLDRGVRRARRCRWLPLHVGAGAPRQNRPDHRLRSHAALGARPRI